MVHLEFGEVDGRMDASDVVVEGDYFFEGTTHAPIEPHCAIGLWEPRRGAATGGKLTVWSSTQVPHYLHRELARVLERGPGPGAGDPAAGGRRASAARASPSTWSSAWRSSP